MAVSLSDSPPSRGPSCPVCYRDYSDNEKHLIPRILQCGHTYCSECLERLLNTEPDEDDYQQIVLNIRYAGREWTTTRNYPRSRYSSNELKCPTCMTMNHVQNNDVSSLTKNFALLGCRPQGVNNKTKHFCKDHNHEKRIYCNDCGILICAYCQLYGGHKGHSYLVATEASKPSVNALKEAEEGLVVDLQKLTMGKGEVSVTISKLARNRRRCERSVKKYYNGAMKKLGVQKDVLLSQIASWTEEQMFILNAQLDMLTKATKDLKALQSNCQSLVLGDPLDALTDHKKVEDNVKTLRSHVNDLSLQPLIHPWMRAKTDRTCDDLLSSLVSNFKLTYDTRTDGGEGNEGEEKEGDGEEERKNGNQSDDDDSSVDSLYEEGLLSTIPNVCEEVGLLDTTPEEAVARKRRKGTRAHNSAEGRMNTSGTTAGELMSSQEMQNTGADFSLEVESETSHFSIGQDLNWVSSINPSPSAGMFSQQMMQSFNQSASRLSDRSESTSSETDEIQLLSHNLPSYSIPATLRLISQRRRQEASTDDSDRELDRQRSHDLSSSGGGGVDTTLNPMEMRRCWDFLNDRVRNSVIGEAGESSKEEDDCMTSFHSLQYEPDVRSAHSDDSSPSPCPPHLSTSNDFSFPHHLSLPVDSSIDPHDGTFPSSPLFSWANPRVEPLQLSLLEEGIPSPSDLDDFDLS